MQQKIVFELQIRSERYRRKALKMAVVEDGVHTVVFEGENRERMVIIGDGIVDAGRLGRALRNKVGYADLQKIVIELQIQCDKCRSKALQIAAGENGVNTVGFKGAHKNQMVIIGDGIIDASRLTKSLRNKVGYADLLTVEELKDKINSQLI
ncbi:hypothetical protein FNV43_RR03783 [Rhamnella rubrinervis]|uniref:Uncharacterized protein n=1 Tax=Rhamnella rubrinervis TaxID=2594499 RepID=A0A8K0HKM6_9ROSA|nr:hypothetical protein FNV43_RR03783 [Rhamnella rubrinervis]